ncbi:MAG TPA: CARDB domain-containing protein [Thermoleophilaceae bacterium]
MSRPLLALLIAGAALAASVTGALAAQSGSSSTPSSKPSQSSVTVAVCHPSDVVAERFATFSGQMRALPGTKRMTMHFTLLERLGSVSTAFKPVSLADLKAWRRSKSGAHTFIYTQKVTALRDGGAYRVRVQFRWYGANKTLLRSTTVRSGTCRQPAPLPDLMVSSITSMDAAAAGQRIYSITVANNGQGDARNVPVALKVDGAVAGNSTVDLLPAQESSVVQIMGPACAFMVRAVANSGRLIPETDYSNDSLTAPCPQPNS